MNFTEALQELLDLTQAASYPVLPDAEAQRILKRHSRAQKWEAGATFAVGAKVVPTIGNGRMYRCVRGGTAGAVSPFVTFISGRQYSTFPDGEIAWEDAGPAPSSLYDLDAAAYEGWMAKAGKVAGQFDFKDEGQTLTRSQMHANCVAMAGTFRPSFVV